LFSAENNDDFELFACSTMAKPFIGINAIGVELLFGTLLQ